MAKITFVVSGVEQGGVSRGGGTVSERLAPGRVKQSVRVTTLRGTGDVARIDAVPGEDVVVVHIANGPSLWLHPETARELFAAQQDPAARGEVDSAVADGEVRIPARLQWRGEEVVPSRGASRGFLGDVLIRAIEVVTDLVRDAISGGAADFAASKVVEGFDGRVVEGVYPLSADRLSPLKGQKTSQIPASGQPVLVLIHGTFSDTAGTFGKLWTEHPGKVRQLFAAHGGAVFALDHATLGRHPVHNALTLAKALPADARLHLLTHSRGGLVAEVLSRAAALKEDALGSLSGWTQDQERDLRALVKILREKRVKIERVVRVACPARGTLLASKRLDAYVSGVEWALRLAGVPVAPELLNFLGEVARRRADPDMLPGLAAQIPDSPLVEWLHEGDTPIAGDLRVVAGDMQGDSVVSWMKTLLSDAFFWTDNDLVVQTRSMYGGSPRASNSLFVLDRGGQVSHFNYFANDRTATAVVDGLTQSAPSRFKVIGPLSWGGASATGLRAAIPWRSPQEAAALPALIVLPGILGSNLKVGDDRVWLGWRLANGFKRLAYDPASPDAVTEDGPIDLFYQDLIEFMSEDHDVKSCAYDWRRPIEESAHALANLIDKALDARKTTGQPVRLIAHSMGGLVARTVQIVRPQTWDRMMAIPGARLLMLGTPNGGSFAPMQMLSGDDTFGNLLTTIGAPFRGYETRELIAQFPGLLQLQADLLNGLDQEAKWQKLADDDLASLDKASLWHRLSLQLKQARWGIPKQRVLDAAVALRRKLDAQVQSFLPKFADKLLLVVGKAAFTPVGYEETRDGLVYRNAPEFGDGRVTLSSARLPGVRTWMLESEHGSLPKQKDAFEAFRALLKDGHTTALAPLTMTSGATRGGAAAEVISVSSRPARAQLADAPPEHVTEILKSPAEAGPSADSTAGEGGFKIKVINGDLTYVAEPLLLGHYLSSRLTGTEAAMDRAIGGAMKASLQRGRYPEAPGECQVFLNRQETPNNPWQLPRPKAVIVAGLGAENQLRGSELVGTVRQAILAWSQRLTEESEPPTTFTVATTLLGSGGSNIVPGQVAQLIAQGVREANARIDRDQGTGPRWPRVGELHIIELYLSRASEAWQALRIFAESVSTLYRLHPVIEEGTGGLRRPSEAGYRGVEYDFISALVQVDAQQREHVVYNVDTKRAQSDVRTQSAQLPLVRSLIRRASNSTQQDAEIGRALFRLLVPIDLEPFIASSSATVLELDRGTAAIPWELLDSSTTDSDDDRPWAIRAKLMRKLRTGVGQTGARDAGADDDVLIIGDPACDRRNYPKLTGARREAKAVADCLSRPPEGQEFRPKLKVLTSPIEVDGAGGEPSMQEVVTAAMNGSWRIIHIAGHGEPPTDVNGKLTTRGVVLSDNSFLGPTEIGKMRFVPELVFFNCCHLANTGTIPLASTDYDRADFAAGVAEAFIAAGVRCVIAAGWAVDDGAAEAFARTFYDKLLSGYSFMDSVAEARTAARSKGGNTWAAYQCYGDPDWRFRWNTGDAQASVAPTLAQEFAAIGSRAALLLALEKIAIASKYSGANAEEQSKRLHYLETTMERFWKSSGELAEAFGRAWAEAGQFTEAIEWYEKARLMLDGSASLVAIEQLANLRVRQAWKKVSGKLADAAALKQARTEITSAMKLLDTLLIVGPTIERESLYGAAYKRLAMVEDADGKVEAKDQAIQEMKTHYAAAEEIARKALQADPSARVNLFYPAMNCLGAEVAAGPGPGGQSRIDPSRLKMIRESMTSAEPEFFSVVGQTEVNVYVSILEGTLVQKVKVLEKEFAAHHQRVSAPRLWESVYDNAVFVLSLYRPRAQAAEIAALDTLLSALARFAGRPAPVKATTPARPPRPAKASARRSVPSKATKRKRK